MYTVKKVILFLIVKPNLLFYFWDVIIVFMGSVRLGQQLKRKNASNYY